MDGGGRERVSTCTLARLNRREASVRGTRETERKDNRNELDAIRIASNGARRIISVAKSICNQRCSRSLLVSAETSIVRIYYNAIRGERYRTFK